MTTTQDPVQFWSRVQPERIAFVQGGRTFTYRELDAAVQETADALWIQGLGAGEHLSLEFEPAHGLTFAIALHALHRIGLLPVPIGVSLAPPERQAMREKALVEIALSSELLAPLDRSGGLRTGAIRRRRGSGSSVGPRLSRRLDAPAALCFTSGTEGEPRAAILTHGNFFWGAIASARNLGVRPNDLWLSCLPLHHVAGLSILSRSAYYGTSVLLLDRFDPGQVHEAIDRSGVTLLSLVPPMLEELLRTRGGRLFPTTLRAALIGGGPAPAALLEEAAELRLMALPTYGLTEATSQVTTLSPREWPSGLGTAGRPLPFVQVEVRDESGAPLSWEEEGEIVVQGATVMASYFEERDAGASSWDGRWFRTGDIGRWDAAGRLTLLDRRADRIVVGGENVSPAEVERVLRTHPAVAEVCVTGLPSGAWGHEVVAAVVPRPGHSVTLEELRRLAEPSLASFKLPRKLVLVEALPRNPSGKLLRRVLRDRLRREVPQKETA